jgi:hypothetical protein
MKVIKAISILLRLTVDSGQMYKHCLDRWGSQW